MGRSNVGRCSSSMFSPIITFVATSMKSTPRVLETKGKDREALRLHSITWRDHKIQKKRAKMMKANNNNINILSATCLPAVINWRPALVLLTLAPSAPLLVLPLFPFSQYLWTLTFFHPISLPHSLCPADWFSLMLHHTLLKNLQWIPVGLRLKSNPQKLSILLFHRTSIFYLIPPSWPQSYFSSLPSIIYLEKWSCYTELTTHSLLKYAVVSPL